MALYLLFESANGFGLFERVEAEEIGKNAKAVQESAEDFGRFGQIMKLKAFYPFETAEAALDAINCLSEGVLPSTLTNFLVLNMPKTKDSKKPKFALGVQEPRLGSAIQESLKIPCQSNDLVMELTRGIRLHFEKFIKGLEKGDLEAAQRGLAHSYSRSKVKFNVNRVDNMIIQAIALLDQLDKDVNTFAMRVREWYSWHFPELVKLVNDNYTYCRLVQLIRRKEELKDADAEQIEEITMDAEQARQIIEAAKISMGSDLNEFDMINIERFAKKVVNLANYRKELYNYLVSKMESCAPSLTAVIGEQVGARLISHAGSLTNLAKYPASTVQILGAEKALFRALKTRSNTPKYGLLYHSSFIGRAGTQNKGRISRFLANKCSLAARIDSFSDFPSSVYGEKLREQVEERLAFFTTGAPPRKNADVMHEAFEEHQHLLSGSGVSSATSNAADENAEKKKKKKKKKKATKRGSEEMEVDAAPAPAPAKKKPKKAGKKSGKKEVAETPEKPVKKAKKVKASKKVKKESK